MPGILSVGRLLGGSILGGFSPAALFSQGEQGVWYDPSDFSTLFQDAAGTTPVTAVEQPVGRILDKSGRGNHATQSTSASRPVLSARVNLLTKTEQFDDAAWQKVQNTSTIPVVTANQAIAPDGTLTADKIDFGVIDAAADYSSVQQLFTTTATLTYNGSIYVRAATPSDVGKKLWLYSYDTAVRGVQSIVLTDSFQRAVYSPTLTSGASRSFAIGNIGSDYGGENQGAVSAFVWGADLRVSNVGVNLPAYQRVNTSTDYDTTGFPYYLRFDGSDDSLATSSINFSGTSRATLFAGARKLSDSALGEIVGLTIDPGTTSGAFALVAASATGDASRRTYGASLLGTTSGASNVAVASVGLVASPNTNVVTVSLDTAASGTNNQVAMRLNGVAGNYANNGQTASTGNLANAVMYIGRRGGTTAPLNGYLYSLIVRGASSTAAEIAQTETWVNGKTGAY